MTNKYKYLFYVFLNVLVLTVPINCERVSSGGDEYTSQASRRQDGPGGPPGEGPGPPPGGPPGGGVNDESPEEPPDEQPDGPPPGGKPMKPPRPATPPENPDRPKPPEGEDPTEDPDEANSDKPLHTGGLEVESPDDALILDYGRYTTVSFHYEARQWMFSPPIDLCYDEYTKCYTSMVAPMPVCMMYSTRYIKTVYSYCDAYLYNCRIGYRYWRVVGYGKCIVAFFGFPALEDT